MSPLRMKSSSLPSLTKIIRIEFATSRPQGISLCQKSRIFTSPISTSAPKHQGPQTNENPPKDKQSSVDAISDSLRRTKAEENNLLSPVNIPKDPDGVLNESHPAADLLSHSSLIVTRQLEMLNIMVGFEQANRYTIMDPQGNQVGYIAERDHGMGNAMARQMAGTHRSFTAHVFDKHQKEVLRFHRPFAWISSRIGIYDPLEVASNSHSTSKALQKPQAGPVSTEVAQGSADVSPLEVKDMRSIGEAQQQWAPLRRKYNLFLFRKFPSQETQMGTKQISSGDLPSSSSLELKASQESTHTETTNEGSFNQFAYVDEPTLSWDFSLLSSDQHLIGSVNRNWSGFGRELLTDTGVYMLRMDSAGLAEEPKHLISQTGQAGKSARNDSPRASGLTLDQRAVMLATAVSVDFDYFSRMSRSGGGMMPMWFPWWGGGAEAGGAGAGAEAGGAAGAGEAGVGEAAGGGAGRAASGMAEGGAVGAGSVAGYEAMQRGAYGQSGDDASPTAGQSDYPGYGAGQAPPPSSEGGAPQGEDVWGQSSDPWDESGGGGAQSGGEGQSSGEGGSWWDTVSDFLED
ncbi:MAG: hypothetical protein Q9191_002018 [Dirinaria sp. TL-2023a]